jgi:hypothetical protein
MLCSVDFSFSFYGAVSEILFVVLVFCKNTLRTYFEIQYRPDMFAVWLHSVVNEENVIFHPTAMLSKTRWWLNYLMIVSQSDSLFVFH